MTKAPAHVAHLLDGYSAEDRAKAHSVLEKSLADILAQRLDPRSDFVMTAGADGVGKTKMLLAYIKHVTGNGHTSPFLQRTKGYAHIDTNNLRDKLVGKTSHTTVSSEYADYVLSGDESVARSFDRAVARMKSEHDHWRKAELWARDRLVWECVRRGLPIALETSSHGEHIDGFINDIKTHPDNPNAEPYRVTMLLADAPLSVKLAANKRRMMTDQTYVPDADIVRKDADLGERMKMFPRLVDRLFIYWRDDASEPLKLVIGSDGEIFHFPIDKGSRDAKEREMRFDANRPGSNVTAFGLAAEHRQLSKIRSRGKTLAHYQPGARVLQLSDVH